jgi:hypothetical protein
VPLPGLAARARLGLAALVGASGLAGTGCFAEDDGLVCNAALYFDGASLVASVTPAAAADGGSYRIAVEAEGEVLATTATWSLAGVRCDGDSECLLDGDRIALTIGSVGPSEVRLQVRFAAAPGGPSEIALTVSGAAGTGSALVRPSYRESEPNGEGCGVWTFAQESFALPLVVE